jgi:hypothetical protein
MPKNMFQRQPQPRRARNVPRHGAPIPQPFGAAAPRRSGKNAAKPPAPADQKPWDEPARDDKPLKD